MVESHVQSYFDVILNDFKNKMLHMIRQSDDTYSLGDVRSVVHTIRLK